MVVRELLQRTVNILKENDIENAVFDANLIVRSVLDISPIDLVLSYNKNVKKKDIILAEDYTKRRCLREPLQYILGVQEFMGLEFIVSKDVLIPRADTEILVEAVLERNIGMSVLDICTGSGCIALSVADFNKNAHVLGVDISKNALEIAKKNAEKLKLNNRVRFEKIDILSEIPYGVYDIIVSNPPYIESETIDLLQEEVKCHEPRIALDGGADGLTFYKRIIEIAPQLLQESGRLYLETGFNQAERIEKMMVKEFKDIKVIKDLCGVNRVVTAIRK